MAWTERYVRADAAGGGNGTTDANSGANGAWTLAEAVAAVSSGQRVNVRAGTYANTTNTRTFATAGSTTAPIWWRGFNTTAGDLDTEPTVNRTPGTDEPLWTFTTGRAVFSGAYQIVTCIALSVTGAVNNALLAISGGNFIGHRLRSENFDPDGSSRAVAVVSNNNVSLSASYFHASSSAQVVFAGATVTFLGCAFDFGTDGVQVDSSGVIEDCVFLNNQRYGIYHTSGGTSIISRNSFYSVNSDAIRFDSVPTAFALIANNIFSESGGWGINNASGANTDNIARIGNLFYSNASGTETGFGDAPSIAQQTDSSSPFVNAAGGDLTLATTSNAINHGVPGLFETETYTSYLDIGAVQLQNSGGSTGGMLVHPGLSGRLQ